MSYKEYIITYCNGKDSKQNWIWWKVTFCNMELKEAVKSANHNYSPVEVR